MPTLVYRPATLDDAALAAELMTAAYPGLAQDPVVTRYRWERTRRGWSVARFIAEMDGRPIAYLDWRHGPAAEDPDRHCEVAVALDAARLDVDLLTSMWSWSAAQAESNGARILEGYAAEDEPEMLEALARTGFQRERLDKVWELDLAERGPDLSRAAAEARSKVESGGIEFVTLSQWADPGGLERLHALNSATMKDIPTSFPMLPETFEDFERRANAPDRRHDRWWIALDGRRPVAMSYLRFPPVRGSIWTGYTCCDREYRGRGLARAVKLQSLAQAFEHGVRLVYTGNDSENAPMLHINRGLGYRPRPGFVTYVKRVGHN